MVTSSLKPLSRKIATHSVMKMLSEVCRGFPTSIRIAMACLGSMCADTSSATTNLVIQSSSHAANWNMLVGNLAGKVYSSSTKSNLVASSFGKISIQHMNRIVGELVHPRTPALRESHSGRCGRSSCRSSASTEPQVPCQPIPPKSWRCKFHPHFLGWEISTASFGMGSKNVVTMQKTFFCQKWRC